MPEIVLWKLKDTATNNEMEIRTPYVIREKLIPTMVRCPLYEGGVLIDDARLAALGLERVGYTQEQLDAVTYPAMYAANPDLVPRVRAYKAHLDGLGLGYSATSDEITAAINAAAISDTERLTLAAAIQSTMHDIEVNLTLMQEPGQTAWAIMPTLIKYLPEVV